MPILSEFVTLPCPEPVSRARRLMIHSFSSFSRKEAVSGLSGRILQMKRETKTGIRPSMRKIHLQTAG